MGLIMRAAQAAVNAAWSVGHARRSAPDPMPEGLSYHPRDPALAELWGVGSSTEAGVDVTPETAMECPPVYACVRLLENTVSTIPLDLFEHTGPDRWDRATDHPLHALMHDQPNDWQTAAEFRALLQQHAATFGNGYGRIIEGNDGWAQAIEPMHPREVLPFRVPGKGIAFRWTPPDGPSRTLLPHEVLHLRCTPFRRDMIRGSSPVELHRLTIGAAIATLRYIARLFANNAAPKGALKVPEALDDEAAQMLRESWERRHKGLENAHKLAILDGGMDYLPIGMTSDELELIGQYKLLVGQLASVWGIPLHMIGETEKSTSWGTGIEQQSIGFITYSVRPWLVFWEQALNRTLLSSQSRKRFKFEHNADGLLRGDFKTRMDGLGLSIQWGLMTPNEARRLLNLPPVEGGDVRLHPLNMAPADKVLDILLKSAPDAAKRALELITGQEVPAGPFELRGRSQPRDAKGRFAATHGGFSVGRVNVDAVFEAFGIRMPTGHAVVSAGVHRKMAGKHREDYEVCKGNLKRCLAKPDYVAVHPSPEHAGQMHFILAVKGLPKGKTHMIVPVSIKADRKGRPGVTSAFGMSNGTLSDWIATSHAKPVKKQKARTSRAFCDA